MHSIDGSRLVLAAVLFTAVAATCGCSEGPELAALSCGDGRTDTPEACDEGDANGTPGRCSADCSHLPAMVAVEGDVLAFLSEVNGARVAGATVSILEHPELTVVTGDDAHFRFEGLLEGTDVTLVVEHPDFKTTQTATVTLGPNGIHPFAIQAVPRTVFTALATLVPLPLEEETHCVIATTVARTGGSLYVYLRQGAAGAQVSLEPAVAEESGPIYFDENVLPAPDQPATSSDGGVLFYRVLPGDYVMRAKRDATVFNTVRFQCRAGMIVNAGPPQGLLANVEQPDHGAGALYPPDAYSAASDALCEATAACVNEAAGAVSYPDVTVASCKAMFRNTWASVRSCDPDFELREAARALYTCRARSCDETLGGDDVCGPEEENFTRVQLGYGTCLEDSRTG